MLKYINKVQSGDNLSEAEMTDAMTQIMGGDITDENIESLLIALHNKGETAEEIIGAANVLREKASALQAPENAVDCCGTGGDASKSDGGTYNISTAVSLVAAACGVPIAKHGNRAASSKSGTADVLEALGVNLDVPSWALENALEELGFAFLMAPHHHSAMKHVKTARQNIPHRTIFNLLGPLANPAGAELQLLGTFDKAWLEPMAHALHGLGTRRAWLVHGADGLDEITVTDKTHIAMLDEAGDITRKTLTPQDFGLKTWSIDDLKGGEPEENAIALRALLEGAHGAYRDIVLANVAAVLIIHESADDLMAGVEKAANAIDSGAAHKLLTDYITFSRQYMGDDSA